MKAAFSGPLVSWGWRANPAQGGSTNPDAGPSSLIGDSNYFDVRVGYNKGTKGWIGAGIGYARVLDKIPNPSVANNISAAAHAVSGTASVLAGASTGITVVGTGGLYVFGSGNTIPAGALVLDGNPTVVNYGLADSNGLYNNKAYDASGQLERCITVTGALNGTGGNFLVSGWDSYGYPMTQLVAATAGATSVTTLKAFKFIGSIVPQFSDAHNYEWGTADIYGFPLRADLFEQTLIWWGGTLQTGSTGFTAADTTNPATNATGDVRGTYAVQGGGADGTKRLVIAIGPPAATLGGALIFGQAQV